MNKKFILLTVLASGCGSANEAGPGARTLHSQTPTQEYSEAVELPSDINSNYTTLRRSNGSIISSMDHSMDTIETDFDDEEDNTLLNKCYACFEVEQMDPNLTYEYMCSRNGKAFRTKNVDDKYIPFPKPGKYVVIILGFEKDMESTRPVAKSKELRFEVYEDDPNGDIFSMESDAKISYNKMVLSGGNIPESAYSDSILTTSGELVNQDSQRKLSLSLDSILLPRKLADTRTNRNADVDGVTEELAEFAQEGKAAKISLTAAGKKFRTEQERDIRILKIFQKMVKKLSRLPSEKEDKIDKVKKAAIADIAKVKLISQEKIAKIDQDKVNKIAKIKKSKKEK